MQIRKLFDGEKKNRNIEYFSELFPVAPNLAVRSYVIKNIDYFVISANSAILNRGKYRARIVSHRSQCYCRANKCRYENFHFVRSCHKNEYIFTKEISKPAGANYGHFA